MNSKLRDLLAEMDEIDALSRDLHSYLRDSPNDLEAQLNIASFRGMRAQLEREFSSLVALEGGVMVDMRLRAPDGTEDTERSASTVGRSLVAFQEAFTASFDALNHGPAQIYRPAADSVLASKLFVSSTGDGSFVAHLFTSRRTDLFTVERLAHSLDIIGEFVGAASPSDLRRLARSYGASCTKRIAKWVTESKALGIAVDVTLNVGGVPDRVIDLSPDALNRLEIVMEMTSESNQRSDTVEGRLVAVDLLGKTFKLETLGGNIAGTIAFESERFEVPSTGSARILIEDTDRLLDDEPTTRVSLTAWTVTPGSPR